MRSMSLVVDLIDLVTKHKSGELRCPATALISGRGKGKNSFVKGDRQCLVIVPSTE